MKKFRLLIVFLSYALVLVGCGGDDVNFSPAVRVDCRGRQCGASGDTYTGTGIGIWTYQNDSKQPIPLNVSLRGLNNNTVTLVFSNPGAEKALIDGDLASRGSAPIVGPPPFGLMPAGPLPDSGYPVPAAVKTRTWMVPQVPDGLLPKAFPSTLRAEAGFGGFRYRIWVADEDWTERMQVQFPRLAALLFGTPSYPGMLSQYIDDYSVVPWGDYVPTRENVSLIPASIRDVDFVIAPNGAGNLQFFDASQASDAASSNQALMMFIGSDALACKNSLPALCVDFSSDDNTLTAAFVNTMLHELTHLINFYQRAVRPGAQGRYDRWLEEAIASSHGFVTTLSRFPRLDPLFFEFGSWFSGRYACSLTSVDGLPGTSLESSCAQNYYSSGQAFLLYVIEQYGTQFYRALLDAKGRGIDAVDAAIRASGGTGFADAFRRWGGMLALLPADSPTGYGYPGTQVGDFRAPAIDGASFAALRKLPHLVAPVTLEPYSHLPLVDWSQSGRYERRVILPAGAAVTIYVY
ncbi:M30 family zinc metallopeptidase [Burkholderia cepacia]|uniref:M30 family zinc metallopeptidase n=1 Tax=Burkholderia cepacia TaxID=292 RepID=UPI0009BE401A|nr:hypothetical protein [Burkholderia cepacia]